MLEAFGYEAPMAACGANGEVVPAYEEETQPEEVLISIRLLCSFLPAAFILLALVCVWRNPITREKQAAIAKLAAQARLERAAQQSETSSVTSTHSPRDVQALAEFISNSRGVSEQAVLDEMQKVYANVRFQEYKEREFDHRSSHVRFADADPSAPMPEKVVSKDDSGTLRSVGQSTSAASTAQPPSSVATSASKAAPALVVNDTLRPSLPATDSRFKIEAVEGEPAVCLDSEAAEASL